MTSQEKKLKDSSTPNEEQKQLPRHPSTESDELASLRTLKMELSDYMERKESTDRWHEEFYPGVERLDYDFTLERQHIYSNNLIESTSHLVKGCLGAGILSIHEGYMRGGIWASLAVTLTIGLLVPYNMYTLVKSAQNMYVRLRVPRLTYPDLLEAAVATGPIKWCRKYSKAFRYSIDVCLFIELCGTCCIYEIMIAKTFKQVLEAVSPAAQEWNFSLRMYILLVMLPLFGLCMIRNLKYLVPLCLIADLFVAVCVLTTMYYSLSEAEALSNRPAYKDFKGLIQFCGVMLYSIDGVGITMPVENNMQKPQYFPIVLQLAMTIVIISITLTGFFGYWRWGEVCESPITIHLPQKTFPMVLQCLLLLMLAVTFALHFWIPFRIIWHYSGRRILRKRGHWERLLRGILVILVTCFALLYPNLIRMMIILGNFFLSFIAFIFPAFIESLVLWNPARKRHRLRLFKNVIIILIGILIAISVFYI